MRTNSIALLRRATIVSTSAVYTSANLSSSNSLLQAAQHNGFSSSARSKWLHQILLDPFDSSLTQFPLKHGISVTMPLSTASASSVIQEVQAKAQTQRAVKFCPKDVVLYQYEACPFCNKVKAFLDYYDIPYKVVEVNPISKKEIKWSDYKKVPILKVDGDQMVNSSEIIDSLYKRINPDKSTAATPSGDEERKWLGWVDDHLVHVLSPNIYRTPSEALESFDYITTHGNFSLMERIIAKYTGAAAMYFVAKKLKKKHEITDERKALYDAAETWVTALKGRQFNGGQEPNLADLATFGVLRPIRHLTSGKDMVENTQIGGWYSQMEKAVGKSCRVIA